MKKPKIQFVYFDIGGVLLHWRELIDVIAQKAGKPRDEVHTVFHRYDALSCLGKLHPDEWGPMISRDLGLPADELLDITKLSKETFFPISETHAFLKEVQKTYPVGLLTNVYHGFYDLFYRMEYIPNVEYFTVVESCRIGMVKPQPEIYHHAQKLSLRKAHEILFIDDLEQNITGAKNVGWQGVVFDTAHPDRSIREIKKILFSDDIPIRD